MLITGFSAAIASRIETGLASMCEVSTNTSTRASNSGTSLRVPRKWTAWPSDNSPASVSSAARRGPSPMTRKRASGNFRRTIAAARRNNSWFFSGRSAATMPAVGVPGGRPKVCRRARLGQRG